MSTQNKPVLANLQLLASLEFVGHLCADARQLPNLIQSVDHYHTLAFMADSNRLVKNVTSKQNLNAGFTKVITSLGAR